MSRRGAAILNHLGAVGRYRFLWGIVCCLAILEVGGQTAPALTESLTRLRELPEESAAERLDLADSILERLQTETDSGIEAEVHIARASALIKLARYPEAIEALERSRSGLLTKDNELETLALQQQRNWALIAGFTLLIVLLLLLVNRSRLKSKQAVMLRSVERERKMNARLRDMDQLKNELLANTSHELRAPLDGITGIAESLIDGAAGQLPQAAKTNLELITTSGRRLGTLVDELLDFSQLHRQGLELTLQPIGLHALADVVLTLSRPLAEGKDLDLIATVDPDLPLVRADENRVQQILLNLVGNAIKFTDSGRVEVSARQEGDTLVVQVTDTGIGIAADELERIFESFQQADPSIGREYRGTGLGLSVSKQLVELHGGRIWAESEPGRGSTFCFTLPIAPDGASTRADQGVQRVLPTTIVVAETSDQPALPAKIATAEISAEEAAERPAVILAVDDEPVVLQVLANHLLPKGYRLLQVPSGIEALATLEKETIDLVLLDVMMPQMSGYEVCRRIREQHQLEELPVLFLTAKTRGSDRAAGFREGANDYLSKPIAKDELLARVSTHLKLARIHRGRVDEVKVLRGLLPICCVCKKIRDDKGYWNHLESYLDRHSEAQFSHGLCPVCLEDTYAELGTSAPDSSTP